MNSWFPLFNLLALIAALTGCGSAFAQETNSSEQQSSPVAEWVAKYRENNEFGTNIYQMYYRKLFELPEYNKSNSLPDSSHPSILIQATWHSIVQHIPETFDDSTPNLDCETSDGPFGRHTTRLVKTDKQVINDFTEQILQKTGVTPPDWWVDMLARSTWREGRYFRLPAPNENPYRPTESADLSLPHNTKLVAGANSLTFKLHDRTFSIPNTEFNTKTHNQPTGVVAFFQQNSFLVTKHRDGGNNHDLRCYDVETGKINWVSNVIGSLDGGFVRYLEPTWVEITSSENADIFVFGACGRGFYIQGFDIDTGASVFRFSTMYNPREK